MTKKITPELLRECRAQVKHQFTDCAIDKIRETFQIRGDSDYWRDIQNILAAIAASIKQYYVELPTDKDGNQLYIGSTIYDKDGTLYYVQGVSTEKRNVFLSKFGEGKDCAKPYCSQDFTKERPDSWERIIKDAFMEGVDFITADDEEPTLKPGCSKDELIARCRKLAGETDE